eukprot:2843423-Amphidinium_carterae.1
MDSAWFRVLNDACAGGFWLQQKHMMVTYHKTRAFAGTHMALGNKHGREWLRLQWSESRWCENYFRHVAYEDESVLRSETIPFSS